MSRLIVAGLGLLSAPLVARLLGPDGRGVTATAVAVHFLVPILVGLGVPAYVRRWVAVSRSLSGVRTARRLAWLASLPSTGFAVLCYFTVFASLTSENRIIASAGVLAAPFAMSWMCDISALVATARFRALFVLTLANPTLYVSMLVLLWISRSAAVATVIGVSILASMGTFVLGLVLVRPPRVNDPERPSSMEMLRASLPYAGAAAAEAAANRADQVLMLPIIGAYQAGLYSVAATLAAIPAPLGQTLGAAYFTTVAQSNDQVRARHVAQALKSGVIASVLLAVVLFGLTPIVVPLLFGAEFEAAVPASLIAVVSCVPLIVGLVASASLAASGRGGVMTMCQLASLTVGIGALLLLGPSLGAMGAALASTIGFVVGTALLILALRPSRDLFRLTLKDFRVAVTDILRKK